MRGYYPSTSTSLLLPGASDFATRCTELTRRANMRLRHCLDVAYGEQSLQTLDIYLPSDRHVTNAPIMIFFHGGAWRRGDKGWHGFMAEPLVNLPAIFISPNYRLAPAFDLRHQLEDCRRILDWTVANAVRLGGDPDRLFLSGHSAGGHLAVLAASSSGGSQRPSRAVAACLPISGFYDLRRGVNAGDSFLAPLLDEILPPHDDGDAFSPILQGLPPALRVLATWGEQDLKTVIRQNVAFEDARCALGQPIHCNAEPNCSHFDIVYRCSDERSVWLRTAKEWMTTPGI